MASRSRRPRFSRQQQASAVALWGAVYGAAPRLLQAAVTKTSTFNSASIDLGADFASHVGGLPMVAVVTATNEDEGDGNEVYSLKLQDSTNDSTWHDCGPVVAGGPGGGAIPPGLLVYGAGYNFTAYVGGFVARRHVRLVATLAGTSPSLTYSAVLRPARPV